MGANGIEKGLVYVVDDDPFLPGMLKGLCELYGKRVGIFSSGDKALEAIQAGGRPEVLITDQMMPGMTGVQLSEEVMKCSPGTYRFLHSGYSDLGDSIQAALSKEVINEFSVKPDSVKDINALMQRDNYTH
jgi:DNA-binding NtrC family response regulator